MDINQILWQIKIASDFFWIGIVSLLICFLLYWKTKKTTLWLLIGTLSAGIVIISALVMLASNYSIYSQVGN